MVPKRREELLIQDNMWVEKTVIGDVVESQYINNYPRTYWSDVDYGDDEELNEPS